MNKRKKTTPKNLSNRQKVKEQAKEISKLRSECKVYEKRIESLREIAVSKQMECDEKDQANSRLNMQNKRLEEKLRSIQKVKKPFWKRVIG